MTQIQYEQLDSFPSQLLETALYIAEGIKEPKHSDALIVIASTYDKLGCRDRALKILDLIVQRLNLIESYQTKINILLQIESIYSDYYRTKEIIDLANSYLKFIEKDSVKINILRRLSNLYINIGRPNLAEELICYYICETDEYEKVKNILETYINCSRFEKLCELAIQYYFVEKKFDRVWQVVEILETNSQCPWYKSQILANVAEKCFLAQKHEEGLSLLELAINAAKFDSGKTQNNALHKIAKIYIKENYQNIAQQLLPQQIVTEEQKIHNQQNYQIYSRVLEAYSLVKLNKYHEAVDFLESCPNDMQFKLKTELLSYIYIVQYQKYIKRDQYQHAREAIEQAINLSITIHQKIIETGLTDKNVLEGLSYQFFLLLDIADIYFKNNKHKNHILEQIKIIHQNIKKQIEKQKINNIQKLYNEIIYRTQNKKYFKRNKGKLLIENIIVIKQ